MYVKDLSLLKSQNIEVIDNRLMYMKDLPLLKSQ